MGLDEGKTVNKVLIVLTQSVELSEEYIIPPDSNRIRGRFLKLGLHTILDRVMKLATCSGKPTIFFLCFPCQRHLVIVTFKV